MFRLARYSINDVLLLTYLLKYSLEINNTCRSNIDHILLRISTFHVASTCEISIKASSDCLYC